MLDNTALRGYVSRLEHIAEQRKELNIDAKDVYDEAREAGLNVKALRRLVSERGQDSDALRAFNETMDEYREAMGMLADTPLGEAAAPRHAPMPTPFAEQPVHQPRRRGRPRKVDQAVDEARSQIDPNAGFWSDQADRTIGSA